MRLTEGRLLQPNDIPMTQGSRSGKNVLHILPIILLSLEIVAPQAIMTRMARIYRHFEKLQASLDGAHLTTLIILTQPLAKTKTSAAMVDI